MPQHVFTISQKQMNNYNSIKHFFKIFRLEESRFFTRRFFQFFLVTFLLLLIFSIKGAFGAWAFEEYKDAFMLKETNRTEHLISWVQVGYYGHSTIFVPPVTSILCEYTSNFCHLETLIDSSEKIKFFTNLKDRNIFTVKNRVDFSFLLIIFSFYSLYYGSLTFRDNDYIRFVVINSMSVGKKRKTLLFISFSRLILLNMSLIFLMIIPVLVLLLFSIQFPISVLLIYMLLILLLNSFFFIVGSTFGLIRGSVYKLAGIFFFFFSVLLFPEFINEYLNVSSFHLLPSPRMEHRQFLKSQEQEKALKFLVEDWEKEVKDEKGFIAIISKQMLVDQAQIRDYDKQRLRFFRKKLKVYFNLSSYFAPTFVINSIKEIGGRGYIGYIENYKRAIELKDEFIKYYGEHTLRDVLIKDAPIVKFSGPKKHLIMGRVAYPWNFESSLLFNISVNIFLFWLSIKMAFIALFPKKAKSVISFKYPVSTVYTANVAIRNTAIAQYLEESNGSDLLYLCPFQTFDKIDRKSLYRFIFNEVPSNNLSISEILSKAVRNFKGSVIFDNCIGEKQFSVDSIMEIENDSNRLLITDSFSIASKFRQSIVLVKGDSSIKNLKL